jgi:hypothetical protein
MFKNTIAILIEDLHSGTTYKIAQGTFASLKEADAYAAKLNDHYADHAIPKIASVID